MYKYEVQITLNNEMKLKMSNDFEKTDCFAQKFFTLEAAQKFIKLWKLDLSNTKHIALFVMIESEVYD